MASNSFGQLFRITTWGESHGPAIGVVIDGCPAGIAITEAEINVALAQRAPGRHALTSPRKEPDEARIYSGVWEGKTTGTPVSIIIMNQDVDSSPYEAMKSILRPGHASFTYLKKYGHYDHRGGGRASARETACRVAAGVLAKKIIATQGIQTCAYLHAIHDLCTQPHTTMDELIPALRASSIFCPEPLIEAQMLARLSATQATGDSLGGVVTFLATGLPAGLGDPIYEKIEANLAHAMLSIPASKGFEIGEGFGAAMMHGSEHNDGFRSDLTTRTNHAGGTLAGVTTGMPLYGQVAFKPTSSINQAQQTTDVMGNPRTWHLPPGSRHDPCVAIRAVPVVDAMCALVLADALLMHRTAQMEFSF